MKLTPEKRGKLIEENLVKFICKVRGQPVYFVLEPGVEPLIKGGDGFWLDTYRELALVRR